MIHPETELFWRADIEGYGVRATARIPAGTLLWVRDPLDVVLARKQVGALCSPLREEVERLGYVDRSGRTIVCWDAGRFVNHCCRPSMRSVGEDAMIAIVDVAVGDELTCDYAECNLSVSLACRCGDPDCRSSISSDILIGDAVHVAEWDRVVKQAVQKASQVEQPLVLHACAAPNLLAMFDGRLAVPSLTEVRCVLH